MNYVRALFILQFHLVRHSLTQGKLIAYFLVSFVATGAILFAIALGFGLYFMTTQWLLDQPTPMVLLALNALMLIYGISWFWGLVMEVQRSDIIDIRKMVHFPVPMWMVNAINFLVSMVGFTSAFYIGAATGLIAGIYHNTGSGLFSATLAAMLFFFLSSAWAYYLRGLLVVWMENKRRRRFLLTVLPFFFMTIGFAPTLIGNLFLENRGAEDVAQWLSAPERVEWIYRGSFLHPGGLLALALTTQLVGEGFYWLPLAGLAVLGALGYYLGYRTTLRYGFGNQEGTRKKNRPLGTQRPPLTGRRIPLLNEETAALAQALFLNFSRHPQVRTMLFAPIGLVLILSVANGRSMMLGEGMGLPVMAIVWPFFMFGSIFFNLFGMDQRGFRTLLLLPTPRHRILLAYHLALVPLAGGMGLAFALFGSWYFSLGLETTVVSVIQVVQLFLNFSLAGSFVSIFAPMAIGRNMMRKQSGRVLLVGLVMPFIVAILVLPTVFCIFADGLASTWGLGDFHIAVVASLIFVATTLLAYPLILRQAGNLLMTREQRIMASLLKSAV